MGTARTGFLCTSTCILFFCHNISTFSLILFAAESGQAILSPLFSLRPFSLALRFRNSLTVYHILTVMDTGYSLINATAI